RGFRITLSHVKPEATDYSGFLSSVQSIRIAHTTRRWLRRSCAHPSHACDNFIVNQKTLRFVIPIVLSLAFGVIVWAALRFTAPRSASQQATISSRDVGGDFDSDRWRDAVTKVKEDRGDASL